MVFAPEIFFSYAHEDEELRDELAKQLDILRRQGLISTYHDRKIGAGTEWAGEIDSHLEAAQIVLLLISSDFLASDYCYDMELARALERHDAEHARVIPIILRPCMWQKGDFAKLQALPTDGEPVTSQKWHTQDAALLSVAEGISRVVEELARSIGRGAGIEGVDEGQLAIWNVPHRRNPNFTGREALLADLEEALKSKGPAALTQAITGLGGIGKTQIALEYAFRHRDDYPVVWWMRAEQPATLASDYAGLAEPLDLPEKDATEEKTIVKAVHSWLDQNDGWLLIFDNAESRESLQDYVPQGGGGSVIITSREPVWTGLAVSLSIKVMEPEEAVEFLVGRTGDEDRETAAAIAEEFGYLPLGLAQAAAYIEETGNTLGSYLTLFGEHQGELLKAGTPSADYPATIVTTWELAIQQLGQDSEDLLQLCSFLAPDEIPLDLIVDGSADLPDALAKSVADNVLLDAAIAGLLRFSLIDRKGGELNVHRMVQAVVRDRLSQEARAEWAEAAVKVVNAGFPFDSDDVRMWPDCTRLLPHALQAAEWVEAEEVVADSTGRLLSQAGLFLKSRADFTEARVVFERALKIEEAAFGPDHTKVAAIMSNLGLVLWDMGDHAGANAHFERALKIDEAAYGTDHPDVAIDINNLALVRTALGDHAGAKAQFERALKIEEAAYGPDHPNLSTIVNNLGGALHNMGNLAGARAHYERALKMGEAAHGPDHPDVAIRLNNLGAVLQDMDDLAGAKSHYERALTIDEAAYGPNHPEVAIDLNNLGGVLQHMGDPAGTKSHFERALKILQASLDDEHPTTRTTRHNLDALEKKD